VLNVGGTGIGPGNRVLATATDASGNTSEFSPSVMVDDREFALPSGYVYDTISSTLAGPRALALGGGDRVFVADQSEVVSFDFDGSSTQSEFGGSFSSVAVDASGTVFVVDAGEVKTAAGATLTSAGTLARSVAFGPDGCLYVVGSDGLARSCDGGGTFQPVVTGGLDGFDIAWDGAGDAYVSRGNGQIIRIPAGETGFPDDFVAVQSGLAAPAAMAFSEDGRLFVSTDDGVMYGRPSDRSLISFSEFQGGGASDLAIGSNSRLFVSHTGRGRVYRFSIPAEQEVGTAALQFYLSDSLRDMMPGVETAIVGAFAAWEFVATADAASQMQYGGRAAPGENIASIGDYRNLITADPSFPIGPQTLAVASKLLRVGATPEDAEILTADIIFNPTFDPANGNTPEVGSFGTDTQPGKHHIKGVAMHELGHAGLGLVHSGRPDATMFFILPPDAQTLTVDDIAAVSRRYPKGANPEAAFGAISGQVTSGNFSTFGRAVGGALIIGTELNTRESIHTYTDREGNYDLRFLPPGDYRIGLFALDGSVFAQKWVMTPGRISLQLATIANETNFLEEYWNGTDESAVDDRGRFVAVSVGAGGSVGGINLITNLDTQPPSVAGVTPDAGATGLAVRPQIRILFSEGIQEGTPQATITCGACSPMNLDVLLDKDGGRFAVLSLPEGAADLSFLTTYEITLSGAIDAVGNKQAADFTAAFTTHAEDTVAPTVVDVSPGDLTGDVSSSALVSVTFSEAMDPASLINDQAGFRLMKTGVNGISQVIGTISLPALSRDVANTFLVFKAEFPLDAGADYDIVLAGATDMAGIALSGATSYSFVTAMPPNAAPDLVAFGPDQSGVSTETQIFADFSEAIDPASVDPSSFSVSGGVSGTFAFLNEGRRVVFDPAGALGPNSGYTVTLTGAIKDLDGAGLTNPSTWSFSTGSEPFQVLSLTPTSAAVGGLVSIQGTGFSATGGDVVTFSGSDGNPKVADIARATVSTLTVIVPPGTASGPVNVNGQGALPFELYIPPDVIEPALKISGTDSGPRDVEVNPDGTIAVVTNSGSNTVSLIQIDSGQQTSVQVGRTPMRVTITPDGSRAYVTNYHSHTVSVIDLACVLDGTDPVDLGTGCIRTIPVGYNPIGIDASPDGSLVYVAEYSTKTVSVIDAIPSSGTFNLAIRSLDTEAATKEIATDPDGGITILASESSPVTTDAVPDGGVTLLASESNPTDVEANPDGTGVWVGTNFGVLAFQVDMDLDQADWGVTMLITESAAREAELDPDGALLLAATDSSSPDVNSDPDGGTTLLGAESSVKDLEANPDGTLLFITKGDGAVLVRGVPTDPYALGDPYRAITILDSQSASTEVALGPDGTLVYVTSYDLGTVSIYGFGAGFGDGSATGASKISYGFSLIEVIRVGDNPQGIAFSPEANFAAVANSGSNDVTFMTFGAPIEVSDEPIALGDEDEPVVDIRVLVAETVHELLDDAIADAGGHVGDGDHHNDGDDDRDDGDDDDDDDDGDDDGDDDDDDDDDGGRKSRDVKDYESALKYALRNLDLDLWTDSTRTAPSAKRGKKVFDNDKQITKSLSRIIKRSGSGAEAALLLIESYLIPADRLIAQAGIDETEANFAVMESEIADREADLSLPCGRKDRACREAVKDLRDARKDLAEARRELSKSVKELDKADRELAKGRFDKAIDKYKKAWDHAGHAEDELAGKGNAGVDPEVDELPIEFDLSQNYPNPFNPVTTIEFAIPELAEVRLEVFDILGRRVQTLLSGPLEAGFHRVQFDASRLASGIYLYRIQAGEFSKVQRMVLMK
jgi:DNA-binding beta-propeller fold protein YncE